LNENRTADAAAILGICIVNLPTYSPNLNPIERLWKAIKEEIGTNGVIANWVQLNELLQDAFTKASKSLSFARKWIDDFWNPIFWNSTIICSQDSSYKCNFLMVS
jgi:transposase